MEQGSLHIVCESENFQSWGAPADYMASMVTSRGHWWEASGACGWAMVQMYSGRGHPDSTNFGLIHLDLCVYVSWSEGCAQTQKKIGPRRVGARMVGARRAFANWPQEGCCFSGHANPNLNPQHNKAGSSSRPHLFWVWSLLPAASSLQTTPSMFSAPHVETHHNGLHQQLWRPQTTASSEQREAWMVSRRECRMGPDLERSTPTSNVAEEGKTTFRASARSLEEDTRRSVTRQGAQSRGSDGGFGTRRLCHEIELAAALKCAKEQASVPVKMDPDTRLAAPTRACFQVGEGFGEGFDRFGDFDGVERGFVSGPQTCPEGGTGSTCRSPNPREGGLHRTGKETERQNRKERQVRSVEEAEHKLKQLRILCTTAGSTSWTDRGRFRCQSTEVASDRGRVAKAVGTLWRTRDSSGCQCSTTEIARRFRAQLCGGDAAVDLGPPTGFAGSHHGGEARGGGKSLPVVVSRRRRVACCAHGCSNDRVRCKHVAVNRGSHGAMNSPSHRAIRVARATSW